VRTLWRLLAGHRDYRLLVTAGLVSAVGDQLLGVGLAFLVYDRTGSTAASAAMFVVSVLPQVLLASAAGVLVDRWDRRRTLVGACLLQAAVLAPLLLADDGERVWVLYVVAASAAVVEQVSGPAEQALVPHLVPSSALVSANAVNGQARNLARLVGSGLGGVVVVTGGLAALALVDAATFLGAAALLAAIRPTYVGTDPPATSTAPAAWWTQWRTGLAVAAGSRTLRVLLLFGGVTAVGEGVMGTLFPAFVRDVLDGDARGYGLVVGIQAVGGIVGGLVVAALGERWRPGPMLGIAAVLFGLVDLTLFLYPLVYVGLAPAVVLMVVVGLPGAAVAAGFLTLLQNATDDAFRGRVFGTLLGIESAGVLVGSVLGGWLGGVLGIVPVIAWQGAGYVLLGAVVWASIGRREVVHQPGAAGAPEPAATPTRSCPAASRSRRGSPG
jgi:MFS family permease